MLALASYRRCITSTGLQRVHHRPALFLHCGVGNHQSVCHPMSQPVARANNKSHQVAREKQTRERCLHASTRIGDGVTTPRRRFCYLISRRLRRHGHRELCRWKTFIALRSVNRRALSKCRRTSLSIKPSMKIKTPLGAIITALHTG